ncbi:hypothetical protein HHI36_007302 [Cryptolaemus montrouzieri]|uniref:MICOS complex subunit MIC60 n=1 Tax=Cryptolaemus montrouzieri TaxID=559131 RepID=A0ABD2MPI5_9CUCU
MLNIISRKLTPRKISLLYDPKYRIYRRCYSNNRDLCPPPKKRQKPSTGTLYTLGAIALIGGGTITYAKYNDEFRDALVCSAPFLDDVLKVIYREEDLTEALGKAYRYIKGSLYNLLLGKKDKTSAEIMLKKDFKAPPAILPSLEEGKIPDDQFQELRVEKQTEDGETKVEIGGVVKPKLSDLPETDTRNLRQLEQDLTESCADAVNTYNKALFNLKKFNQEVECLVEESIDKISTDTWSSIKSKAREKDKSLQIAKEKADETLAKASKLESLVQEPEFQARDVSREILLTNIRQIKKNVEDSKKELYRETKMGSIAYKYWEQVQKARQHFSEELESLFPTVDLQSRELKIHGEDLDLFLMHAYSHVLYYQKELAKAETLAQDKLQRAVDAANKGGGEALTTAQICEALEQEKRKITLCYQKQCLKLRKESECYLREQLKRQSQAFADHLEEALLQKEREIDRGLARKFDEKLEEERCRFKMQLAAMIGRLRGLDRTMKIREMADEEAKKSQILWAACQTLLRALRSSCPGLPWQTQLRSLTPELNAVEKSAAEQDELVKAVLKAIPFEARDRGIFPEDALRERFLKVEKVARMVALVPAEGAALPVYILSFIQSLLLINAPSPIPQAELNNEETDFSELSTNDILQRARYWLDRGNFTQTLKYMNLLKGASRSVARQWMNEARILLETQQAANTLIAHAASSGLMYL